MLTKMRNAVTTSVIAFLPVLPCREGHALHAGDQHGGSSIAFEKSHFRATPVALAGRPPAVRLNNFRLKAGRMNCD